MSKLRDRSASFQSPGPMWPRGCWPDMAQQKLLQACLLKDEAVAQDAFRCWESQLEPFLMDGGSTKLLLLLYRRISDWGIETKLGNLLKGSARFEWARQQLMSRELTGVIDLLNENGIDSVLLKGAALNASVYKEQNRLMADLDVMVPREKAREAIHLLAEAGWQSQFRDQLKLIDIVHGCHFRKGGNGHLDLHWDLFHGRFLDRVEQSTIFRSTETCRIYGREIKLLSPALQLLHTCEHGVRHNEDTPPFRWLSDAFMILDRRGEDIDWELLSEKASTFGLLNPVLQTLHYLEESLSVPIPDEGWRTLKRGGNHPGDRLESFLASRRMPFTHSFWKSLPTQILEHRRRRKMGDGVSLTEYLARSMDMEPPILKHLPALCRIEVAILKSRLHGFLSRKRSRRGEVCLKVAHARTGTLSGFHSPELFKGVPFRWTGTNASIVLPVSRDSCRITIEMLPLRSRCDFSGNLAIRVNRDFVPWEKIEFTERGFRFSIEPKMFLSGKNQRIELQCKPWSLATEDSRDLGLPIICLRASPIDSAL